MAEQSAQGRRSEFIRALREYATFLEQHPDVDAPVYIVMNVFVDTKDDLVRHARASSWEKTYNGPWFSLTKHFGQDLQIDITAPRTTVCRRVVVGQATEPAKTVDVVEWQCEDEGLLPPAAVQDCEDLSHA